jgi:SAM-dependent methyltransferase
MTQTIVGNIYDHPQYYDILFGADWRAELRFLTGLFARHVQRRVRRVFEPACGTGRLLVRLGREGYQVAGNDLNRRAIEYCNERLVQAGLPATAVVGDMSNFTLRRPVDACFNLINSFRHLTTEPAALGHLQCIAGALAPGGIYALGLHLMPTEGQPLETETWKARRGSISVTSHMATTSVDIRRRAERISLRFDVRTPKERLRLLDEFTFRTYTLAQAQKLLAKVPALECVATYDFLHDLSSPIELGPDTQDVIFILRKIKE